MTAARVRAWLGAFVALCVVTGIALLAWPNTSTAPGQGAVASSPNPQGDATGAAKSTAVRGLLQRRADALLHHDKKAFLATVDPKATAAFRTTQTNLFDNLAGVPLGHWAYRINPVDAVDPAALRPADPADLAGPAARGDELWAPRTDLDYALRGVDAQPTTKTMGYLYVRRGAQWYLRSDTALDRTDRRTWRGPWDFAPAKELTTKRGFVLYHPGDEEMARRLADELDSAVQAVSNVWGTNWPMRVAMVLPATATEMRALVGPDFPINAVVAVSVADHVDRDHHTVQGQRVVFSPNGSRGLSPVALRVVVRHEFTHIAARADTVDGTPLWVLEGFADYVGYRTSGVELAQGAPDLAQQVAAGQAPSGLPTDAAFRSSGHELDLAYQQAWTVMKFLGDKFGQAKLVQVYRALAGAGAQPGEKLDQQLRGLIGMDRTALVAEWREYLRRQLG
ncbi:hypothetical protein [Labedaea rhizosphaerae]|uniref:hypothetical protein n=1 Tax=Labedaea rhizosphaerae TaxID=598644 RepID=UPI00105D7F62|nr:hypothetical protein [Labedaea rhizosphaerae]